ncbi:MAG: sensor histidine kinase, partial [Lachnospiraceae bacterium]|nr:sensor histidine kinase [Lachnospiraceae bacterium]
DIKLDSEDLKDLEVPRLSIEPLVENAVVHGLEVSDKEGHVEVLLSSEDKDLIIHVKDNGVGFDIESLDLEETGKNTGEKLPREKVGVKNTNRRIKLMYGKKYGLKIHSKLNEGTDIEIRIPKKKWVLGND